MRKIDYINRALSAVGISGITSPGDDEDLNLSFMKLESMVYEWEVRNITINWDHAADINGESGAPRSADTAIIYGLALRIAPDYSIPLDQNIRQLANAGFNALLSDVQRQRVPIFQYPARMGIGSGNRIRFHSRYRNFYREFVPYVDPRDATTPTPTPTPPPTPRPTEPAENASVMIAQTMIGPGMFNFTAMVDIPDRETGAYLWDYGDNTNRQGLALNQVSKTYTTATTVTVSLTVTDEFGFVYRSNNLSVNTGQLLVTLMPPSSDIIAGESATFTARFMGLSDDIPAEWTFTPGDTTAARIVSSTASVMAMTGGVTGTPLTFTAAFSLTGQTPQTWQINDGSGGGFVDITPTNPNVPSFTFTRTYTAAGTVSAVLRVTTVSGLIVDSVPAPVLIASNFPTYTALATGPAARSRASMVRAGDSIYLLGGLGGSIGDTILRDLWRYSISTNTWQEITLTGATSRIERTSAMFFLDNLLFLAGGSTGSGNSGATNLFTEINLGTGVVRALGGNLIAAIGNIIGYGRDTSNNLYFWGGTNTNGFAVNAIVQMMITAGNNSLSSTFTNLNPTENTLNATTLLIGSEIFTYYGADSDRRLWRMATSSTAPVSHTHTLSDSRQNGIAAYDDDFVYFMSGTGEATTGLRFEMANNAFSSITVTGVPSVRNSSFVAANGETFVFGGVTSADLNSHTNSFGVIR